MKIVTGLFDTRAAAEDAVKRMERAGFDSDHLSIVSRHDGDGDMAGTDEASGAETAEGAGLGAIAGGLLMGVAAFALPGIGPVVGAGWLASALAGTTVGAVMGAAAGSLVEALKDSGVNEEDAHLYAESIRRGGAIVSARVDDSREAEAHAILDDARRIDPATRRQSLLSEGWNGYVQADDELDASTQSDFNRLRSRI